MSGTVECLQISPECPIEATVYGYYPSLPANAFFIAFFGLCFFLNLGLGTYYNTWTYMLAMLLACVTEVIGYGGRIMLYQNPFSNTGFIMQICCLIIGPAFNSAALYLTLKHITLTFGSEWSRIRPSWYTYIFIGCDLSALVLQAVGGALASTSNGDHSQLKTGDNVAMAGIAWQVAILLAFAIAAADYAVRRTRATKTAPLSTPAASVFASTRFRIFAGAMIFAHITIFTRCVYRIVEFAGGWQNPIMQDEASFIALEGVMIVLATAAQTAAHPGFFFPQLSFAQRGRDVAHGEKVTSDSNESD